MQYSHLPRRLGHVLETCTLRRRCASWPVDLRGTSETYTEVYADSVGHRPKPVSFIAERCRVSYYPGQFSEEEAGEWMREPSNIHKSTIGVTVLLEKAGLRCVTMEVMGTQLEKILQYVGRTKLVSQGFKDRFRSVCDDVRQECEEVEGLGLPNTFSHCDLRSSNIFRHENGVNKFGILDSGESSISNPLMDAVMCVRFKDYVNCWARYFEAMENGRAVLEEAGSHMISNRLSKICDRLSNLRDLVLNPLKMDEMESHELPQLRSFMRDSTLCVVQKYESERSRRKELKVLWERSYDLFKVECVTQI